MAIWYQCQYQWIRVMWEITIATVLVGYHVDTSDRRAINDHRLYFLWWCFAMPSFVGRQFHELALWCFQACDFFFFHCDFLLQRVLGICNSRRRILNLVVQERLTLLQKFMIFNWVRVKLFVDLHHSHMLCQPWAQLGYLPCGKGALGWYWLSVMCVCVTIPCIVPYICTVLYLYVLCTVPLPYHRTVPPYRTTVPTVPSLGKCGANPGMWWYGTVVRCSGTVRWYGDTVWVRYSTHIDTGTVHDWWCMIIKYTLLSQFQVPTQSSPMKYNRSHAIQQFKVLILILIWILT